MARVTGPKCKICRRAGEPLMLKGVRCHGPKCAAQKRPGPPGPKNFKRRKRSTEYSIRLREKQKVKSYYGVLEKKFRLYFAEAGRLRGNTGENLLVLLERRLDNVVFRSGFAASINQARQMVLHGHFQVNGRKVSIPSFSVRDNDVISVKNKDKSKNLVKQLLESAAGAPPSWLAVEGEPQTAKVISSPNREEVPLPLKEQLVVEFCSR